MSHVLKVPSKFSLNSAVNRLEFGILVIMLLYFVGATYVAPFNKLIDVGSYAVLGLLIILNFNRVIRVASKGFFIWLVVALAVSSVVWSVNPEATLDTAKGLVRTSLMGVYLAARYPFTTQMKLWFWVFGLATIFSLLWCLIFPQPGAWIGIFPQKNYLARIMALSAELFLVNCFIDPRKRRLSFVYFVLSIIVLLGSQGKTSLILFLCMTALLPVAIFLKQHYKLQVFLYLSILVIASIVAILLLVNLEFILVDILGKNLELNGRLPVWQLCIDKIQERPLFGYGYAAFWKSPESLYVTNNSWASVGYLDGTTFNPHHGFIGNALALGLVGVSLVISSLISTFSKVLKVLRLTGRLECLWMLQFLVFLLVFNLFDNAGLISGKDALWSLYVSVSFSAAIIYEQAKRDSRSQRPKAVS